MADPSLPPLPAITRLSPRVLRILGGNPSKFTLQGTNTYLIGTGPSRILLDTAEGFASWKHNLQQVLRDEHATVSDVILSHWHPDHVGGIADAHALCPHPPPRIWKNQTYPGTPDRDGADQLDFADGHVFSVAGATLTALHTPGHTIDHMAFLLAEEGAMFTGDNVLGHGTAVFEDLATYLASLGKMRDAWGGGRAYPGHGEVLADGRGKIEEYIAHRRQRETEVVETLGKGGKREDGGLGSMELVKVIYRNYPEHLHGPAEGSVLHVLRKLEGEGRVREEGGKWRLTEKAAL